VRATGENTDGHKNVTINSVLSTSSWEAFTNGFIAVALKEMQREKCRKFHNIGAFAS